MNRILRPSVAMAAALVMLLLLASLVLAETRLLDGKLRTGDTVTVPASERVADDLYVLAGTATIDGSVDGDILVFGGQVSVNGDITGDLIVAGGTVTIAGDVQGDGRVAGGTLTVAGTIGEDLVIAGGQTSLAGGSMVGGDLIASGGSVSIAGNVTGNIEANAGTYSRTGTVGGVEHVVQSPETGGPAPRTTGDMVVDAIRHFVILLILGALALWLVPRALRASDETLRREPLLAVGGGLATLIGYVVFVVAAILLMILLAIAFGLLQVAALVVIELVSGLLTISIVSFLLVLAAAYFADLVVGLALGRLVASGTLASRWQELGLLAAGAAVVVTLTSLPAIGFLAKLVVICLGIGAMAVAAWRRWRGRPPEPAIAGPEPTPEPA
jgi:hypothetical protein